MKSKRIETGYGIASFVLSIFGFLSFPFFGFGIVPAILSVIYSNKQKKINSTGLSTAGLILGIISIVINGFIILIILLAIVSGLLSGTLSL